MLFRSDEAVLSTYPSTIRRRVLRHLYQGKLSKAYLFSGCQVIIQMFMGWRGIREFEIILSSDYRGMRIHHSSLRLQDLQGRLLFNVSIVSHILAHCCCHIHSCQRKFLDVVLASAKVETFMPLVSLWLMKVRAMWSVFSPT